MGLRALTLVCKSNEGNGSGDVRELTLVCKSNEGNGSGDVCVKEAKRKVLIFVSFAYVQCKSLEQWRRHNKSPNQNSRKILEKRREVNKKINYY